jgi:hypothetical protein
MIRASQTFYTYWFGKMGRTLETARRTEFFERFHLVSIDRTPQEPGQVTRFRPSGEKFRKSRDLDILEAAGGQLVQMELRLSRPFIDGRDHLFAQDLVKNFLVAVLPDACQHLLKDFMQEIKTPGAPGNLPGSLVFAGKRDAWATQTGWSRLSLSNVALDVQPAFVVRVWPNPDAPNATRVGGKSSRRMPGIRALFGLTMLVCACHKPAANPELSLKGSWNATGGQVSNCGAAVPVTLERLSFVIQDAPLLNHAASSFNLEKANVTGTVNLTLHMENARPLTVASGILVGEILNGSATGSTGTRLQGYILSESQYGAWVAKNKQSPPPPDAGEVDLEITGNAAEGYTLTGDVRSSSACGKYSHLDAVVGDMTGHFGRTVASEWSAKVTLQKL